MDRFILKSNHKADLCYSDKKIHQYIYIKYFITIEDLIRIFKDLKIYKSIAEHNVDYFPLGIDKKYALYGGRKVIFKHQDGDYYFPVITDYFQEECKIKCIRLRANISFYDRFMQIKDTIAKYILSRGEKLSYSSITQAISKFRIPCCSEFDPSWMIDVCRYIIPSIPNFSYKILDMSAGRGSRLIAAAAMGCDYVGVDPSECCHKNYKNQIKFATTVNPLNKYTVIKSGYEEDFKLPEWMPAGEIDIMISSPPYFNVEIFEDKPSQSVNKYKHISVWVKDFLLFSMKKTIDLLKSGGYMCINIDNPRDQYMDYVNPMLQFSHPRAEYMGLITIMKTHLCYSFWIWRKN